ncbi:MAG: J domain-containing protein [Rhodothermaceae bacterium]|nr:J domain-containing protein [Rhodothermaceae bacterium]
MARSKNYYSILGVDEKATTDQIKKRFRLLARQYHPDRNPDRPDAEERFKVIQEAYDVLSNEEKRKEYDRRRKDPLGGFQAANGDSYYKTSDGTYVRYQRPPNAEDDFFSNGDTNGGFSNIFNRIFGAEQKPPPQERRKGRRRSSLDVSTRLRLSLEQALLGGKTEVTLPHGEVIRINIPKGVHTGFKIRLKGRGEVGATSTGDLYVTFEVEPHSYYRRRGNDLHITAKVNPIEAMVGITRNIMSAYGNRIKLKIPSGTQHGTKLRLRGQGVQTGKELGDMYVHVELHIPEDLTPEQLKVLKEAGKTTRLL